MEAPKDRNNYLFLTLLFQGLGTLVAWNMFITAKDYFVTHKLGNAPVYAQNFLAYVGWASQIPNLTFSWFNVFVRISGDLVTRILWSLSIEVIIFVLTIVLAMVDSSTWPGLFFWLTMISVFWLNVCNAIFQNSVFGVAARLPPAYTGVVILGSNICGTLVVLLSMLTTFFPDKRTAAIYYFFGGMCVLLFCFDSFIALPLNKLYRFHSMQQQKARGALDAKEAKALFELERNIPFLKIFQQAFIQLYNVCITFAVTIACFPAVISDVHPTNHGFLGQYFVLITCFLTVNSMAMVGNITAGLKAFPSPRLLVILTTARLIFIPLFLMCNYQPPSGRSLGVMISNDWIFWLLSAALGWSSGHCSSLAMMYIAGTVAPEHTEKAGMMGGAMLITGIMTGICVTFICPQIVK